MNSARMTKASSKVRLFAPRRVAWIAAGFSVGALTPGQALAATDTSTSGSVVTGVQAFQDELNVGIVYWGVLLGGRFGQRYDFGDQLLSWDFAGSLAPAWGKGMTAIELEAKPVDFGYLFRMQRTALKKLWLGPGLTSNYRWFINPELQSGSFFWYTHYDLEIRALTSFHIGKQAFEVDARLSLLTLASRPDPVPEPYFYDWSFSDMWASAHSNLVVGSLESASHLEARLDWFVPKTDLSLTYQFVYEYYLPSPSLQLLKHSLGITWH